MKIGIVLHPYGEDKPAGLARIIFELTQEMIARFPEHEFIVFLKKTPHILPEFFGKNWKIEILNNGILWLDYITYKTPCDVYIFNTPSLPFFWKPKHSIVLVLDFAYWYFRPSTVSGFLRTYLTYFYHRFSLAKADCIVSISEATQKDLLSLFPIKKEKIKTVYFGFCRIASIPPTSVSNIPERFFLFTGVWKERKNVLGVIKAFELFANQYNEGYLVCAGGVGGNYGALIKKYIACSRHALRIHVLGFVSDAELSYLYRHAHALVFPSFIEGFGFPILEAMDAGLPVITSNCSSLAEIAGSAALLANPHEPKEIAKCMSKLYHDEALWKSLREKGITRARQFKWENTVGEFMEIIKTQITN